MMSTVSTPQTVPGWGCPGFDADGCPWGCKTRGLCGECEYQVAMRNTKPESVATTKVKRCKHNNGTNATKAIETTTITAPVTKQDAAVSTVVKKKRHSNERFVTNKTTNVTINVHNYNTYL